jgi:hypothetical protein
MEADITTVDQAEQIQVAEQVADNTVVKLLAVLVLLL